MKQVVVLCGGLGTRLGKRSAKIPKALLKVNKKPFISYVIDAFVAQGFKKFHFCLGHLGDLIESYLEKNEKEYIEYTFSYDEVGKRGTLHALEMAYPYLDDTYILTYGDTYLPVEYKKIVKDYKAKSTNFLMTILKNEGLWDTSNVIIGKKNLAYYKPHLEENCNYIDYGLFVLDRDFVMSKCYNSSGHNFTRVLNDLNKSGIQFFEVDKPFYEIGTPEAFKRTEKFFKDHSK